MNLKINLISQHIRPGPGLQFECLSTKWSNKTCTRASDMWMMSFNDLHEMAGRATPDKLSNYKLALQLYKTYNYHLPRQDWINLNLQSILTTSQKHFLTHKSNILKVGMNCVSNRFYYLNGIIKLNWLNLSMDSFKVKCKRIFL